MLNDNRNVQIKLECICFHGFHLIKPSRTNHHDITSTSSSSPDSPPRATRTPAVITIAIAATTTAFPKIPWKLGRQIGVVHNLIAVHPDFARCHKTSQKVMQIRDMSKLAKLASSKDAKLFANFHLCLTPGVSFTG